MAKIVIKAREAKKIKFIITEDGSPVDCSSATDIQYAVEKADQSGYLIEKAKTDFDLTDAATGILKISLSVAETDQTPGLYTSELLIEFDSSNIDISEVIDFHVKRSIFKAAP